MACRTCGGRKHLAHKRAGVDCVLIDVQYLGLLPFACWGAISHERYQWSTVKPIRPVYECDLPSVTAAMGGADKRLLLGPLAGVTLSEEKIIEIDATPIAKTWAARFGIDLTTVIGTGENGKITVHDIRARLDDAARQTLNEEGDHAS